MFTSVPVIPPWDQGDKNLAFALAKAMTDVQVFLMTTQGAASFDPDHMHGSPIYQSARPGIMEKARAYSFLLQHSQNLDFEGCDHRPESNDCSRGPDLYHLIYRPYMLSSAMFKMLPEFRRRPTVHTVPATANDELLGKELFFADRIVALSEYGKLALEKEGLKDVRFIPSGIDTRPWKQIAGQENDWKALLGLSGRAVILFPGHYGPGQGADIIHAALPEIVNEFPQAVFLFACRIRSQEDSARENAIRSEVARLGLSDNVIFYNTVAEMQPLIGASDLVALPLETMRDKIDIPTTLLEAMAAGKPVIISDIPPMNELFLCNAEVGLTVPKGSSEGFASAVISLLRDKEARKHMGMEAQRLVLNRFDIHWIAEQYRALYRELL
jgi:glycosyltransferase involved in cell wall biosynthesis